MSISFMAVMASHTTLLPDMELLFEFMHDLPEDFDGYLSPDNRPIAYRSVAETQEKEPSPIVRYSRSLHDLNKIDKAVPVLTESPFGSLNPFPHPWTYQAAPLSLLRHKDIIM